VARARSKRPADYEEERSDKEREEGRYRIYVYKPGSKDRHGLAVPGGRLICLTATPANVEATLAVMREEKQITNDSIVGIKDDVERKWLINPLAKGDKS
jgi:hypothetical protein